LHPELKAGAWLELMSRNFYIFYLLNQERFKNEVCKINIHRFASLFAFGCNSGMGSEPIGKHTMAIC
jgi:hypothetical protein